MSPCSCSSPSFLAGDLLLQVQFASLEIVSQKCVLFCFLATKWSNYVAVLIMTFKLETPTQLAAVFLCAHCEVLHPHSVYLDVINAILTFDTNKLLLCGLSLWVFPWEDLIVDNTQIWWEAAQFPKVKVAKVDATKLNKEQTVYMPKIPDIARCPEHLLPLKEWEDAFLADFSELRLALSRLEGSSAVISDQLQSMSVAHEEECSHQLSESIVLEKIDDLTTNGTTSCCSLNGSLREDSSNPCSFFVADETDGSHSPGNSSPKSSLDGGSGNGPSLSMILGMDSVARVSMLKKHISSVKNMCILLRSDCAWLFALCAAIDTPLVADTSAALRCLLRKCATLRAEKSELDDEVVMLNILATISGRYFGQSEN
ncbi:unnamed protein product [Ilex paraguariensis]|uniref:Gem-associated protein 2 n=1 Tax=Ilex paraguariensis TaxID=185542 RepID=A0ABC8U610_9AQUA